MHDAHAPHRPVHERLETITGGLTVDHAASSVLKQASAMSSVARGQAAARADSARPSNRSRSAHSARIASARRATVSVS
ncbi:hypothetical protein SAOR_13800 [Salinisphaera orenii MK-B5]|uniref:Uncharacterized protein n=1 Tax=Salinisphaera orenii MK-B5 TaxID=856730 RepID=A0A423PHF8_9GAMM|nr:hypothetical protein SAOR_13800 [Salinisphaera orenii MK-B5]